MKGYRRTYLTESKDKQTGCALEFTPVAPLGAYSESLFFFFFRHLCVCFYFTTVKFRFLSGSDFTSQSSVNSELVVVVVLVIKLYIKSHISNQIERAHL